MKNEGYIGNTTEVEILDTDEQKVRDLLGGLKRVDAPKNFEFRLKSRIASTAAEDLRPRRLIPVLRYAAPLAAAILLGTYFVFTGIYSVDNNSVSTVQEFQPVANVSEVATLGPPARIETAVPGRSDQLLAETREDRTPAVAERNMIAVSAPKKVRPSEDRRGGSFDTGLGSPKVILPKSMNANSISAARVSIREILSTIGINAEFGGGSIDVKSVAANSMAARSGIAAGDVLETINGQPVNGATMFESQLTVTSLGVRRDGKSIQINLR